MLKKIFENRFALNYVPVLLGVVLSLLLFTGCAEKMGVAKVDLDKRFADMTRTALTANELSEQTQMFLWQHDLLKTWKTEPDAVLKKTDAMYRNDDDPNILFVLSELCFLRAKISDPLSHAAFNNYLSACFYAYTYLFGKEKARMPSAFNPNFRQACDFYNRSLAGCLIYVRDNDIPLGSVFKAPMLHGNVEVHLNQKKIRKLEEFQSFHLAYEFEPRGFQNHVKTCGIGVPVIAIKTPLSSRDEKAAMDVPLKFQQTYSVTALLRFTGTREENNETVTQARFNVFDPMKKHLVTIDDKQVLLENDFTTALAYTIGTTPRPKGLLGLLRVDSWDQIKGLYLLQPFDPEKIPVVLVHGLMSSPDTWLPMLNNLLADPVLREKYQFWFFMYPTGNPIVYSSSFLRESLAAVQHMYNPDYSNPNLKQMVLVGHSMGGLVSKLMVMGFDRSQWNQITGVPFEKLNLKGQELATAEKNLFFKPLPYISRMVFISTPHRGSEIANWRIGRLGSHLVKLPVQLMKASFNIFTSLAQTGRAGQQGTTLPVQNFPTGIDGLRPQSMFVKLTGKLEISQDIPYHSIIGDHKAANTTGGTDGVVPYSSSHLDGATSELIVHSGHNAHKQPLAIQEVRRILHLHLEDLK